MVRDAVGPRGDCRKRLAARAAVAKEVPAGPLATNVLGAKPFILAVINLCQVGDDFQPVAETGQLASLQSALPGAGEHMSPRDPVKTFSQLLGVLAAQLCQRDVGSSGVSSGSGPFGLPVANQVDAWQFRGHRTQFSR